MSDVDTKQPAHRPTRGMLALARDIAEGRQRDAGSATTVPASVYTDPDYWQREKAAIYDRLPQIVCPSALLPDPGMALLAGDPRCIGHGACLPERLPAPRHAAGRRQ